MLPGTIIAVEFRNRSWFGACTDETLQFLRDHRTGVRVDRRAAESADRACAARPHGVDRRVPPR
jgi:uncharacterized protein YecE (DUF72 family)